MKCLEKDRAPLRDGQRPSGGHFTRHLNNEPVVARPQSQLYRFQKLVRRNKLAFTAAAAIATVVVLAVVASTRQAIRASRAEHQQTRLAQQAERDRQRAVADEKKAESEAARSAQVARFMKDMLKGVGPSVARGRDTSMLRDIPSHSCSPAMRG